MPKDYGKSKIGLVIGFGGKPDSKSGHNPPAPDTDSEDKDSGKKAETMAMRQFMKAETPEAKADAMRSFLEACGVY